MPATLRDGRDAPSALTALTWTVTLLTYLESHNSKQVVSEEAHTVGRKGGHCVLWLPVCVPKWHHKQCFHAGACSKQARLGSCSSVVQAAACGNINDSGPVATAVAAEPGKDRVG